MNHADARLATTTHTMTATVASLSMGRIAQSKNGHEPKICAACGRPFEWRKKWERVWDEVKYCSDRCRNARR